MTTPFQRPVWPGGARCAVALSFDNFGESLDLLRYGHAGGALADGVYAPRRGVERILDVLGRHNVPATFFVEGWNARKYAGLARDVDRLGHEVGAHGWMHETWDKLSPDREVGLVRQTVEALADAIGRAPRGWRSPGGLTTTDTLSIVRQAGFRYDSSFGDEDIPYTLAVAADRPSETIVELPWTWQLDDAVFYAHGGGRIASAASVLELWKEEFDAALAQTGYFMLVCHPRFSGRPARAQALDRLIGYIRQFDGIWFARCEDIAAQVAADPTAPRYSAPEIAAD